MRATLDPDKFYMFLRAISQGKGVNSSLVSREGTWQVVDPDKGSSWGRRISCRPEKEGSGAQEIAHNGDTELVAYAWLKEVPWVLIVRQPLGVAYATMYKARRIMIASILGPRADPPHRGLADHGPPCFVAPRPPKRPGCP